MQAGKIVLTEVKMTITLYKTQGTLAVEERVVGPDSLDFIRCRSVS